MPRGRQVGVDQPWTPTEATERICAKARDNSLTLCLTDHAKEQMLERELIISDIIYVLENGFVYDVAEPATQTGYFKYRMESETPNSGRRSVRVVVIPHPTPTLKIVTVMWVGRTPSRGG